jgi:thiamine biosynthesis lipoprotein
MRYVWIAIAIALTLAAFATCTKSSGPGLYRKTTNAMYTAVTITVAADSPEQAERAIDSAINEVRRLEGILSFWTEESEIAAINKSAGISPVKVSPDTFAVIEKAQRISEWTGGAFDATIGPVIRQWDFKQEKMPEPGALKDALKKVGYTAMQLDPAASTAFLKRPEMSFDTGGIAKGHAADVVVQKLKAMGIKAALVAVAGDIRAYGKKPDGSDWRVGIRHPRSDDPDAIIATLALKDGAISTSGDYERFFMRDGVRYHHILDPATGYPAQGSMSVTVIANTATWTDGLATGIFVMDPEKGLSTIESLGFKGVIISSEGKVSLTPGLEGRIDWTGSEYRP